MYTSILQMYVYKSKYVCINKNILIQYMVSLYYWSTLYLAYFNHSTKVPCVELLSGHKVLSLGGVLSRFSRANISSTLCCPKSRKKKHPVQSPYLANYERNPFKYSLVGKGCPGVCVPKVFWNNHRVRTFWCKHTTPSHSTNMLCWPSMSFSPEFTHLEDMKSRSMSQQEFGDVPPKNQS